MERGKKGTREQLVVLLDRADQAPVFAGFVRLPPEIRNRVYGMYFADLQQPLVAPVQPPLTLTSSQVRSESLQMFYDACTFEIRLEQRREWNFVKGRPETRLRIPPKTLAWFAALSTPNLRSLRRLRFDIAADVHAPSTDLWRHDRSFCAGGLAAFELEVVRGERRFAVEVLVSEGPGQYFSKALGRVRRAVGRAVGGTNGREGGFLGFTVEDVRALRRAMEG